MAGIGNNRRIARVLVVEDSPVQAAQLKSILEMSGYEVDLAGDGLKGFELFCAARYDLVLTDVVMPELSGYELCRKIKSHSGGSSIPVILVTQLSELKDTVDGLVCGADSFVRKPVDPAGLIHRIQRVLADFSERADSQSDLSSFSRLAVLEIDRARLGSYLAASFDDLMSGLQSEFKKQLVEVERQLESSKLREEFMTRLSHDLKSPLVGAEMVYRVLLEGRSGQLLDEQKRLLSTLRNSNKALLEMVHNLVDVYRFESGYKLVFERIDVLAIVNSCIDEMQELARDGGLKICLECDADKVEVTADRLALRRLVTNLLGNAVRYTPAGGSITVRSSIGGGSVAVVEVADTGPGISKEKQKHLFERFYAHEQAGDATRHSASSGLGLYICRQIAEAHGAELTCTSEAGSGSTFTLSMPNYCADVLTNRPEQ